MDIKELEMKLQEAEARAAEFQKKYDEVVKQFSEAEAKLKLFDELQNKISVAEAELSEQKQLNSDLTAKLEGKQKPEHLEKLIKERDEAKQKFRELTEQFNSYKAKAEEWDTYKTNRKEKLLKDIEDEEIKSIASKLDIEDVEAFINKLNSDKSKVPSPPESRTSSNVSTGWVTDYKQPDTLN